MSQTRATPQGEHSKLEAGTQRRRRSNVFASQTGYMNFYIAVIVALKRTSNEHVLL